MNARLSLVCGATAVLAIAACSGPKEDPPSAVTAPTTTTPAATTTTVVLTVEGPQPKAGIELHVKAEVDGRTDGLTGSALSVAGARAALQSPTGWATTKGDVTVVTSADKKAQLGATSFGTDGAEGKLAAAAAAMGLTGCEWNPGDRLSIGKTAISGMGADGKCTRGTTPVQTAWVGAEGLLVVGAWEAGGDSASVFGSMRSITKLAGGAGGGGLGPCCAALRQNANSAPPDQKNYLIQAAAICDGLRNNPQTSVALAAIRSALKSANMPSQCR